MQYLVTISQTITVEADDEDDAMMDAAGMFDFGSADFEISEFGSFTIPPQTALNIVAEYNKYAKTPIQPEQAHLLLGDDFDADLIQTGQHRVYVGRFESTDGNPHHFDLYRHQFSEELN